LARSTVSLEEMDGMAADLELSASRLRKAIEDARAAGIESLELHWSRASGAHLSAIGRVAKDAEVQADDAARAKRLGIKTAAEGYKATAAKRKAKK
jgi:hypothetical protein